ncbi:MAG: prolyl oligopeptidase family serine peptidase [Emcibacteraceae bacterium]|nr:prolyl oligopeptidase family serine peptidase [Emcibacteraceae bacterium]
MLHRFIFSLLILIVSSPLNSQAQESGFIELTITTAKIFGDEIAKGYSDIIDPSENISWEIYLPKNYDKTKPAGVMVYISPQNTINVPENWMSIMDDKNLIWIAARKSGNKIFTPNRILYALAAMQYLQDNYTLDAGRIYISGFSGGGRIASIAAVQYPTIFKGAAYICGANFWDNLSDEQLSLVQENRFIFITGTQDFNLNDTKTVYGKYKRSGAENIKLMVINRMGHATPKRRKFSQAIQFLDEK